MRRALAPLLAVWMLACVMPARESAAREEAPAAPAARRRVVITIDDLPAVSIDRSTGRAETITRNLLDALRRNRAHAIGFVNEGKLQRGDAPDPARVALLRRWIDDGLELGNHTFSHLDLHRVTLAEYEADLLRGEAITRDLLSRAGTAPRYFRHPYLHTGRDAETRRGLAAFLAEHGYRVAPVTIDNYDYLFAAAFDRADLGDDDAARESIASSYLDYMGRVVAYYEQQSVALFGREIPQVLLLHASALNARAFDSLAGMLRDRGYSFITLDEALADEAYASPDEYYGPAGITWLHRWALTEGRKGSFFAGEPEVPGWIEEAAR